jgi:hypothetical protein
MNITLTQQDADFILRFIRADLENISETQSQIQKKHSALNSHFTKKLKDNETAKELMSFANEFTSMVDEAICETKDELEKCIMLLTVGSEVSE